MNNKEVLKRLNDSFGSYRAEWLKNQIFDLFAEPFYFPALQDNRPCVLEGGRGTGKTTALRGLSYQGQYAIHQNSIIEFDKTPFIGIYHKVNTNHVRAFTGGNIDESQWQKIFGHYFNLIICRDILNFIRWHLTLISTDEELNSHACRVIGNAINLKSECHNLDQLLNEFDLEMYSFQSQINNISEGNLPRLSLAGDPIKVVTDCATSLEQFKHKMFYFLIDEYENFEDYQQIVLNTLIKHSSDIYTFKIGVRELGWRIKYTLNKSEQLVDPADYVLVNIESKLTGSDKKFSEFAKNVCKQRIRKLYDESDLSNEVEIDEALQSLAVEEEALLLGVKETTLIKKIEVLPKFFKDKLREVSPLYRYFISYWSKVHEKPLLETVEDFLKNRDSWDIRYDNYKYEMLFKSELAEEVLAYKNTMQDGIRI